jgi:hypothetical protein
MDNVTDYIIIQSNYYVVLRRFKQEDQVGYIGRPCLKKNQKERQRKTLLHSFGLVSLNILQKVM